MLVLSRRQNQSVVFPEFGIQVKVARIESNAVRLGVTAPRSVVVLREELAGPEAASEARHRLRGRINTATLALHLARRQLEAGRGAEAGRTLADALAALDGLEADLAPPAPPRPPRRITALLVEDNPHESALLDGYLRLSGVDVINANDGEEALEYLAGGGDLPDAVVLDMRMPRRDGPSTVAAIRAQPAYNGLKLFAISGARPEEVPVSDAIDGWFTKPLDPARIVQALSRAVAQ